jgi:hypothetical protein
MCILHIIDSLNTDSREVITPLKIRPCDERHYKTTTATDHLKNACRDPAQQRFPIVI